jgi:hypothetical protein
VVSDPGRQRNGHLLRRKEGRVGDNLDVFVNYEPLITPKDHNRALTVLFKAHREVVAEGPDIGAVRNPTSLVDLLVADNTYPTTRHDLFHVVVCLLYLRHSIFHKRSAAVVRQRE